MMQHRDVQLLLYEYVRGEVDSATQSQIANHLRHCRKCSEALEGIRHLLAALPHGPDRDDMFIGNVDWTALHRSIMDRVEDEPGLRSTSGLRIVRDLVPWFSIRPGYALAVGLVVIFLISLLFIQRNPVTHPTPPYEHVRAPVHAAGEKEIGRYFRQSRALLVGLSNLDPPGDAPVDLSVERELSRRLIIEGRSLRDQKLDPRSSRLLGDIDRIMERVSRTTTSVGPPEIHTLRRDIRGQNLLVKLRVAESSYANIPVTRVREGL